MPAGSRFCPSCGLSQDEHGDTLTASEARTMPILPPRLIKPGTRVGERYVIESVIGEGGMGVVYRGRDTTTDRVVAIKALHANLLGDSGIRKRFIREAKVMTRWTHPNVVSVYELITRGELLAFAMELVEGPTLEDYLERWGGQLPYDDVASVFDGVLDAMETAHDQGVIHRDLKPQNILLVPDERGLNPKVADFGIAKVVEGTSYTMTGALLGSCRYMSPEQVESDHEIDHRSDIYSLGVTLYRALAGRCPFETENQFALMMAHVKQEPEPPSRYRPRLPGRLENLVMQALAKDPDERPQTCAAFREELSGALADVTPSRRARARSDAPIIESIDGSELILIEGGRFLSGPSRRDVFLDSYYIARTPVTNKQFLEFLRVTDYEPDDEEAHRFLHHWRRRELPRKLEDHPVVFISWVDANAYCTWAGLRLPTEAEWEKAARGPKGAKYPWGKTEPGNNHANFGRTERGTTPVGHYPDGASPYGILDMSGNVWEWCEDIDDPEFYLRGPERNPRNTVASDDDNHVVRGGSWMFDAKAMRTIARSSFRPTYRLDGVGFRCAR
jgi:serine/threonine-protein kinase